MGCKQKECSIKPRCYVDDPYEPPFYVDHDGSYSVIKDKNGYVIGMQEHINGAMQIRNALEYYSKRRNKKMFDNKIPLDGNPNYKIIKGKAVKVNHYVNRIK